MMRVSVYPELRDLIPFSIFKFLWPSLWDEGYPRVRIEGCGVQGLF